MSLTTEVEITRSYFVPRCTLHLRNLSNGLNYLYLVVGCLSSQGIMSEFTAVICFFFADTPDSISYFYFLTLFYTPKFFQTDRIIQYFLRQEIAFLSGWVMIFFLKIGKHCCLTGMGNPWLKDVLLEASEAIHYIQLSVHLDWLCVATSRIFTVGFFLWQWHGSCNALLYLDKGITDIGTALGVKHFGCQLKLGQRKKQIRKLAMRWNFLLQSVTFLWSEKSICRGTLILLHAKTLTEWESLA